MKIITKDFQSLAGINEFEFPVGITIIQGKSGSGKSTLFYAIQFCLENTSGVADCINWFAKEAEVRIINNGADITWIKTPSSSKYINNLTGKEYVKASKIDSRDLGDLGFYFDNKDNIMNIHGEWSVLFPFGQSDTDMFKMFEDIFNISCSFAIIEDIKKDEQDIKKQITETTKEIDVLKRDKLNISNILEQVDENITDKYINDLSNTQTKLDNIMQDLESYKQNIKITQRPVPIQFSRTTLLQLSERYNQLKEDYTSYLNCFKQKDIKVPIKYFNIQQNPIISDYNKYNLYLSNLQEYLQQIMDLNSQERLLREQLSKIKVCPTCGHKLGE